MAHLLADCQGAVPLSLFGPGGIILLFVFLFLTIAIMFWGGK